MVLSGERGREALQEGFSWLLLAANSNNADAQGKVAELYLKGIGTPVDPVEAGKWFLLNQGHSIRREIGAKDVGADVERQLFAALDAEGWRLAETRAGAWQPIMQEDKAPYVVPEAVREGEIRRRRR